MNFDDDRGVQICHSSARNGCLKARCLRDRPFGQVSAVRPSRDAQALGIGDALRNQVIDSRHHVFEICSAPVATVEHHEVVAVPGGSANVGAQHGIARVSEKLGPRFVFVRPVPCWSAVDEKNCWELCASLCSWRAKQCCLDLAAIESAVAEKLGLREWELC